MLFIFNSAQGAPRGAGRIAMAAGEDTVPAARAAGTTLAMSFAQSHHGQVAALGQLT